MLIRPCFSVIKAAGTFSRSSKCFLQHWQRNITGTVTVAKNSPEQSKPEGKNVYKKIPRWKLLCILFGGVGAGTLIVEWRVKSIKDEIPWDYDWDKAWNPVAHSNPSLKDSGTVSGMLERLQSSRGQNSSLSLLPTPYRSTKQVIFVRHGQYKNIQSSDDDEQGLTALGEEQADLAGQRIATILKDKKVRGIYHSDMKRAKETASRIAKFIPHVPLKEDPTLAEGVPEFPEPPSVSFQPTNLEVEVGRNRINAAFQKYFFRPPTPTAPPSYEGEYDVYDVIVCHGNVIRYMFCKAMQFPTRGWLRLATFNCGITWLSVDNKGYVSAREFGNVGFIPADKVTYY